MSILYIVVSSLAALFACVAFLKKEIPFGALFAVVAVATGLHASSYYWDEPMASAAKYTAVAIASALLVALGLAKVMPKDNGPT